MPDPDLFLFVSHVREDRQAALEIVNELEQRDIPCWVAPRDVRPGKPFDDEIAEAIEASWAMLLIFSEHCNEHEYIRREITVAGESHKIIILFRIEDAQPRRGLRVRLSDLHWIDGFVSRERAIDQVVRTIDPDRARQQEEEHQVQEERRRTREWQYADRQRRGQETISAESIRPDHGVDLVSSIKSVTIANERPLAATANGLIKTISDPQSPTIIKIQLVYAALCVMSFSICGMIFVINAILNACCGLPLEVIQYLIFVAALLMMFLIPMLVVTIRAAPITDTYGQISNLSAVTRARRFHKAPLSHDRNAPQQSA